jgi:hypothetical protein
MKLDALGRLVWEKRRPPRGLDAGQATVIALPEVSDGLPALVPGANGWGIYAACGAALERPVRRAFDNALREAESSVDTPLPEGDDLVEALRRLIAAGLAVSAGLEWFRCWRPSGKLRPCCPHLRRSSRRGWLGCGRCR